MAFIEFIFSILPSIKTVLLAIIPLGFIIFIHELGHFYAAKRSGIKVNAFALGFGPKLIAFQRGDTEYRLCLLPFGGYVQMEGENPNEQTGAPGEFASASLGSRAFVVVAGPAVNLLFGVLVYWLVFAAGLNTDSARLIGGLTGQSLGKQTPIQIGWLDDDGPAAAGGLMPGDTIVSMNGDTVSTWPTFQTKILTSAEKRIALVVERNGEHQTLFVTPEAMPSIRGKLGMLHVSSKRKTEVRDVAAGSFAATAGIQAGDLIETLNGETLYNVPAFGSQMWHPSSEWLGAKHQALYHRINQHPTPLEIGIRRGEETLTIQLPVQWRITANVQPESSAETAGIQNGDILVSLNGAAVDSASLYTQLTTITDKPLEFSLLRQGVEKTVTLPQANVSGLQTSLTQPPVETSEKNGEAPLYGLTWQTSLSGMQLAPQTVLLPEYNVFTAFGKGVEATWLTFTTVTRTLQQLIGGEVSPKHLTGPIGIANVTSRMFDRVGLTSVLFFIGFISINLCIVNLLPIPIADGGHLLFFAIEKIRGRPMPRKAQEIVQQVSIYLLIALFLYITWFDGISLLHDLRN